jgi:hypothetical protein
MINETFGRNLLQKSQLKLILLTNQNDSLLEVFDSPNTLLLYALSYVWRNPISFFRLLISSFCIKIPK